MFRINVTIVISCKKRDINHKNKSHVSKKIRNSRNCIKIGSQYFGIKYGIAICLGLYDYLVTLFCLLYFSLLVKAHRFIGLSRNVLVERNSYGSSGLPSSSTIYLNLCNVIFSNIFFLQLQIPIKPRITIM